MKKLYLISLMIVSFLLPLAAKASDVGTYVTIHNQTNLAVTALFNSTHPSVRVKATQSAVKINAFENFAPDPFSKTYTNIVTILQFNPANHKAPLYYCTVTEKINIYWDAQGPRISHRKGEVNPQVMATKPCVATVTTTNHNTAFLTITVPNYSPNLCAE